MQKLRLSASLVFALLFTFTFAQQWDGADSLPTNPLSCDGGAGEMAAMPYDGGTGDQRPGCSRGRLDPYRRAQTHRHRLLRRDLAGDAAGPPKNSAT